MSPEYKSPNSQPHMEALNVMRNAPRMITGTFIYSFPASGRVDLSSSSSGWYGVGNEEWLRDNQWDEPVSLFIDHMARPVMQG